MWSIPLDKAFCPEWSPFCSCSCYSEKLLQSGPLASKVLPCNINMHIYWWCRADLTAAKVIPDVLTGLDPVHGVKLQIAYGDTQITTKGSRLERSETLTAPSVQVPSNVPSATPP